MTTATKTRTFRTTQTGETLALVVHEQEGQGAIQVDCYFLTVAGESVIFAKHDGVKYTTTASSCTCPGHKYYGHKTICKHRAAVAKLRELGRLPVVVA